MSVTPPQQTGIGTLDEWISREQFLDRAARAASGFRSLGVDEGDVVAILLRNDLPFLEASLGANQSGAYSVPINWHQTPGESAYVLADSGASVLVVHADLYRPMAELIDPGVQILIVDTPPAIRVAYNLSDQDCAVSPDLPRWRDWLDRQSLWDGPVAANPGSIIYTSGTTGKPKGVKRAPMGADLVVANKKLFASVYGTRPNLRTVISTPLYHASPNAFARNAAQSSAFLLLVPKFTATEMLQQIEQHRLNVLTTVPTVFIRLLKLPADVRAKYDVSSLEWVSHTASPCPRELKHQIIDWWGPIIHETYGGTETGTALHCSSQEWLAHPGTVGRPVVGCDMMLLDDERNPVPLGEPGEIFVRNSGYPDFTYLNRPDARAEIDHNGYVSLGDVGYLDADGYLYMCDRKSDMVIFAGTNVYPAETEAALVQHPDVRDCAVVGIPDPDYGETLLAFVQLEPTTGDAPIDFAAFLKGKIAGYKIPREFRITPDLPREESGKIKKRKLRDAVIAEKQL